MLSEVKKCAECRDVKGLRYIFVDSLDVDPTFEKYKEDYEFCKKINGFFEPYVELNPLLMQEEKWNMNYWDQLKLDLMKNFSEKRFEHMISVAHVVYAEKRLRLLEERTKQKSEISMKSNNEIVTQHTLSQTLSSDEPVRERSKKEKEDERFREMARQLEEKERQKAEERRKDEEKNRAYLLQSNRISDSNGSKKWVGIVLVAVVIVVVVLICTAL